jgi:hypothetical protein
MRSDSRDEAALEAPTQTGGVHRLLDSVFGFGVWAAHLLIVYVSTAVACQLGLGSRTGNVQSHVVMILSVATVGAAAVVVWHAVRRHHQQSEMDDRGFLARMAVGQDAIAVLAILWQLMPLSMVPVCR